MIQTGIDEVKLEIKTINHKDLIDLSREAMGLSFTDECKCRELAMKLSTNFHLGLLSLIGLILEELTHRFENELKDAGRL